MYISYFVQFGTVLTYIGTYCITYSVQVRLHVLNLRLSHLAGTYSYNREYLLYSVQCTLYSVLLLPIQTLVCAHRYVVVLYSGRYVDKYVCNVGT